MKILYVGETWRGSSARSMRESLEELPSVLMEDVGVDRYMPAHRTKILRGINRLIRPWQVADLERAILQKIEEFQPEVMIVFKGSGVRAGLIHRAKSRGVLTVNIFPDCSPHAHGLALQESVGACDLVISTKRFHPGGWKSIYGYSNKCMFVPHGYDPSIHLWDEAPENQDFDVVLAASWRPQYHSLMVDFAGLLGDSRLRVGIAGPGWANRRSDLPENWTYAGPIHGRAYGEFVRRGKIAIAPVHREMSVSGIHQPGDEDTRRTYELAAAHCFFVHRRTEYVQEVYDEKAEVPMWDSPEQLANLVRTFLTRDEARRTIATAAHLRAVPAFSIAARAAQVLASIKDFARA